LGWCFRGLCVAGRGSEGPALVVGVELREGAWQVVEGAAQDGHVVRVVEVLSQGGARGQGLEVVGQDLAPAAATLAVLEAVEEALQSVVGAVHEAYAPTGLGWQRDGVAPQVLAVGLQVAEDEVDGLARVLGRAALGAALAQGGGQAVDGGLDVLKLGESLECVGGSSRRILTAAGGLGREAQGGPQLLEELRTAYEDLGNAGEGVFAEGGLQDGAEALDGLEELRSAGGWRRQASTALRAVVQRW
jgi:hypothetical protein